MRTAWLMVGVCASIGVACSSFNGSDAPPGEAPDGGSTDDGGAEAGMITGQVPDNTFSLAAPTARSFVIQGQMATVTLTLTRGAHVDGPVSVTFAGLPDGITATNTSVGNGVTHVDVMFMATADAVQTLGKVTATATTSTPDGTNLTARRPVRAFPARPVGLERHNVRNQRVRGYRGGPERRRAQTARRGYS